MRQSNDGLRFRLCREDETLPSAEPPAASVEHPDQAPDSSDVEFVRLAPLGSSDDEELIRLELPAPASGPVLRAREPDIEMLAPQPPRSVSPESDWDKPAVQDGFPIPAGWIILVCVIFSSSLIWALIKWQRGNDEVARSDQTAKTLIEKQERDEFLAKQLVASVESAIRTYFRSNTVEDLSRLVRHPERVNPLMREYYKGRQVFIGTVSSIKSMTPLNIGDQSEFWLVPAVLSNGHRPLVTVEVTRSGQVLVDWESLVCYQPMDWTEYAEMRPKGSTMDFRVYAEPVNFNSHEFKDSKEWLCVRLTAHGSEEFLFGYARIHSEVGEQLRTLLRKNQLRKSTFTLRLSIPLDLKSPRGVIIDEVLFPGWICLDPTKASVSPNALSDP